MLIVVVTYKVLHQIASRLKKMYVIILSMGARGSIIRYSQRKRLRPPQIPHPRCCHIIDQATQHGRSAETNENILAKIFIYKVLTIQKGAA